MYKYKWIEPNFSLIGSRGWNAYAHIVNLTMVKRFWLPYGPDESINICVWICISNGLRDGRALGQNFSLALLLYMRSLNLLFRVIYCRKGSDPGHCPFRPQCGTDVYSSIYIVLSTWPLRMHICATPDHILMLFAICNGA